MATWKEILTFPPTSSVDFNSQNISGVNSLSVITLTSVAQANFHIKSASVDDDVDSGYSLVLTGGMNIGDGLDGDVQIGNNNTQHILIGGLTGSSYIDGNVVLGGWYNPSGGYGGISGNTYVMSECYFNKGRILLNTPESAYDEPTDNYETELVATAATGSNAVITLPDATGTVALTSDITGTNTNTNSGDVCTTDHSGIGYMEDLSDDVSPSLGGDLNLSGSDIIGAGNILITPTLETSTLLKVTYNSTGGKNATIDCTNSHVTGSGWLRLLSDSGIRNHVSDARSIVKHENDMTSDSSDHLATQQSIKKYVDDENKYEYEYIVCNYGTTSDSVRYFPLCGYVLEQTSLSSINSEYTTMIAPHDGTFYKLFWRPATAQTSGTAGIKMYIGSNGDTHAVDLNFQSSLTSWSVSADYTYINEIGVTTALTTGAFGGNVSNAFSAGDVISIGFDPTVAPNDVKCTVVLKYNMTT